MSIFKPYKINENQLDSIPIKEGQIFFILDSSKIFLDKNDTERVGFFNDAAYDAKGSAAAAEKNSKDYTDSEILNLINGAPETLDTLKELAEAIEENEEITNALNAAIGNKIDKESGEGKSISYGEFIVSTTGWYRVAEYVETGGGSSASAVVGAYPYSCTVKVQRNYSNNPAESYEFQLISTYNGSRMAQIYGLTENQLITSVRHTVDRTINKTYLEIYYSSSTSNTIDVTIIGAATQIGKWVALKSPIMASSTEDEWYRLTLKPQFNINNLVVKNEAQTVVGKQSWISYPEDGIFQSRSSTETGMLIIVLPPGTWTNTFINFTVCIFNYFFQGTCEYRISGYPYNGSSAWINSVGSATSWGSMSSGREAYGNLPVKFGVYNSKPAVSIGNATTVWSYPNIQIKDIQMGYQNYEYDMWKAGWQILISPDGLSRVDQNIANPHTGYKSIAGSIIDTNNESQKITFSYSKTALDTFSWLAAWNGYELRALDPAKLYNKLSQIRLTHKAGSWISGKTLANASIYFSTNLSSASYHPLIAIETDSHHVFNFGGIGDQVGFWGFLSSRTSNGTDMAFYYNFTKSRWEMGNGLYISDVLTLAHTMQGNAATATTATTAGSCTGNSATATALTSNAGSATQPIYFSGGKPVACSYTLGKSVPSNAVFTDTTYSAMGGCSASAAGRAGLVPAPAAGKQTSYLRGDGAWAVPPNTTYSAATQSAAGLMSAADKKKLDGVATGANAYTHPSTHPATIITTDATHRFVTDTWTSSVLLKSGGTMTGALNMNGQTINLASDAYLFSGANIFLGTSRANAVVQTRSAGGLAVLNSTGAAYVHVLASAFTVSSSRKVKKNIKNMTDEDAEKILKYRVVTFDYIDEDAPNNCDGMIAEEVAEIHEYPVTKQNNEIIGLDYSKFVPSLIKMIQIQNDKIKKLEEQIMIK